MFKRCLTSLFTLLLIGSVSASAAAQSGAVRHGKTAVIKTVSDTPLVETPTPAGTGSAQTPPAARAGNQLSDTAKFLIAAAVITTIVIIAVKNRRERVCGPLSGCPLF